MPEHLQLGFVAWCGKQETETVEKQRMWRGEGFKKHSKTQQEEKERKLLNKN